MKTWYNDMSTKLQQDAVDMITENINRESNFQFHGSDPRCCSTFGCGHILTDQEALFGDKCVRCQTKGKQTFKHYNL